MIRIKPFSGYRPHQALVEKVVSLPYDVVNMQEAKEIVKDNPYSFLNIDKYEVHLGEKVNKQKIYQGAEGYLKKLIEDKVLISDLEEGIYIYKLEDGNRTHFGIVACVYCEDYKLGNIKRHERVRKEKKKDRVLYINTCNYQTAPIMIMHEESSEVQKWIIENAIKDKLLYDFKDEKGVSHKIFKVSEVEQANRINNIFKNIEGVYLVDGHHRAESLVEYAEEKKIKDPSYSNSKAYNYMLAAIFGSDQLSISSYNRVIKNSNGLSDEVLWERIKKRFNVALILEPCYTPDRKNVIGMRYKKQWYRLELKDTERKNISTVKALDVNILQEFILGEIFGITDPTIDCNIEFIGANKGIKELNKRTNEDMDIAFSLLATDLKDFMEIVNSGDLMPPKSTWFEPKIRRGLFVYK